MIYCANIFFIRESLLSNFDVKKTYDPENDLIDTMSHELVHMWFGNIVTPEVWGYRWLTEGFAQFYGIYFTDKVVPDKKNASRKRLNMFINARNSDKDIKEKSTTVLTSSVHTLSQYENLWPNVVYDKGFVVYL